MRQLSLYLHRLNGATSTLASDLAIDVQLNASTAPQCPSCPSRTCVLRPFFAVENKMTGRFSGTVFSSRSAPLKSLTRTTTCSVSSALICENIIISFSMLFLRSVSCARWSSTIGDGTLHVCRFLQRTSTTTTPAALPTAAALATKMATLKKCACASRENCSETERRSRRSRSRL